VTTYSNKKNLLLSIDSYSSMRFTSKGKKKLSKITNHPLIKPIIKEQHFQVFQQRYVEGNKMGIITNMETKVVSHIDHKSILFLKEWCSQWRIDQAKCKTGSITIIRNNLI
jgi:hypothetical protein